MLKSAELQATCVSVQWNYAKVTSIYPMLDFEHVLNQWCISANVSVLYPDNNFHLWAKSFLNFMR